MKLLKYSLFMMAPLGTLSAAVTDFTGLAADTPLTNISGWTLSEANSSSTPIAFVGLVSGNPTGALGGDLGDILNPSNTAKLTLSSSFAAPAVGVSLDVLITDSSNSLPTRDSFGIGISSGSGASIVQLSFLPVAQSLTPSAPGDIAQWTLSYTIAGSSTVLTNYIISESMMNTVNVMFNGGDVQIMMSNNFDTFSVGGSVAGFDSAVGGVGNVAFNWTKGGGENGDNTMYFDNINVQAVPEPSALLLTGCASLLLLKRRRK